jgi:tetratricopeptide (TPR) repeat protein
MWPVTAALLLLFATQNPDPAGDGLKALDAGNYTLAAEDFGKALAANPSDFFSQFNLALAYSMLHKDTEAIAAYKKVLELKPGLYEAQLNLGTVLLRDKLASDAAPYLLAASKQKPKEIKPQLLLAQALFDSGSFAEAAQAYEGIVAADPKSAGAELGLARALLREKRLKDSEAHFLRAAELDPKVKADILELGVAYENGKQTEDAIRIYGLCPEVVAARERLGELLVEAGRVADAIPYLERAVQESPTAANRLALAVAYSRNKQPEKGLPLLAAAVEAEPGNLDLRTIYGRDLFAAHKYAAAAREFSHVAEARPDSVETWNAFAAALNAALDDAHALQALDHLKALGVEEPAHLYMRAGIQERIKDRKGALDSYKKFLAADNGKLQNEEFIAAYRVRVLERELGKR